MTTKSAKKTTKNGHSEKRGIGAVTFDLICESFEEKYGHGWKRRLAEAAGVPESSVHSWLKAGKMPPWILKIFGLLIENALIRRERVSVSASIEDFVSADQVVETDDGYSVYRFRDGVGKLVAKSIPDRDTAIEYASLPRLKALTKKATGLLWELRANKVIPDTPEPGSWASDADEIVRHFETWARPGVLRHRAQEEGDKDSLFQDVFGTALELLPERLVPRSPDGSETQ